CTRVFHTRGRLRRASRQDQVYGRALAAALALELAAELSSEGFDQPTAVPGIGASRIDPLTVVGDCQAKLAGSSLQGHSDRAPCLVRKAILDGIRHELVDNEPDRNCPFGRQEFIVDVGLERDGCAAFLMYYCDQVAA